MSNVIKTVKDVKENYISWAALQKDPIKCKKVPQVERPPFLWHTSSYDGPMAGYCVYNGKPHKFECFIADLGRDRDRYFAIIEVTSEQWGIEEMNHKLFRETVGWHCDYIQPEGVKRMDRYPEHSDFAKMSAQEKESKTNLYFNGISQNLITHLDFKENKVVAFWHSGKNNGLLQFLKEEIKCLAEQQIELKKKRKVDSAKHNGECYYLGQKIRAHLVAYGLLRGKKYSQIEKRTKPVIFHSFTWINLTERVVDLCKTYSQNSDEWTQDKIKQIILNKDNHE